MTFWQNTYNLSILKFDKLSHWLKFNRNIKFPHKTILIENKEPNLNFSPIIDNKLTD